MIVKIHQNKDNKILAICDKNLLGKKFFDGELQLEVNEFYNGEEMREEKILEELKDANIVCLIGEESIKFGLKHKLISEGNIIKVKGVPHAQGLL